MMMGPKTRKILTASIAVAAMLGMIGMYAISVF